MGRGNGVNIMAEIDEGILSGTINANFKAIAETPALIANRMNQDMAQHTAELTKIGISSVGQILNKMNDLDPAEAASIHGVVNSTLAGKIDELGSAIQALLATGQINTKIAQTTPPQTGQGG